MAANILLFGAYGLSKTYIASSIGFGLVGSGYLVKFIAVLALMHQLQLAKQSFKLQDELYKDR